MNPSVWVGSNFPQPIHNVTILLSYCSVSLEQCGEESALWRSSRFLSRVSQLIAVPLTSRVVQETHEMISLRRVGVFHADLIDSTQDGEVLPQRKYRED